MKRFKSFLVALAFIFAGVLAFSLASHTKVHAEGTTVTYTVTSKTAVSTTGTAPTGASAIYSQTASNAQQITKDNSATLTLKGWVGKKITALVLSVKSNSSAGTGSLDVTAGNETIASIPNSTFKNANWNGAYSTTFVEKNVTLSNDNYTIRENEDVKIVIAATVNSLYIESYKITYEEGTITDLASITLNNSTLDMLVGDEETLTATLAPNNATYCSYAWASDDESVATVDETGKVTAVGAGTTTISAVSNHDNTIKGVCDVTVSALSNPNIVEFRGLDLQEQLAFNYKYANEWLITTAIINGGKYYIGNIYDNVPSVAVGESTAGFASSTNFKTGVEFTLNFVGNEGYFTIVENSKYLSSDDSTTIAKEVSASYDGSDKFLWSFDTTTGKIINKSSTRYMAFANDNHLDIRAYKQGSNPIVTFIGTNGEVTFKDAANNEDKVTMRIGYTISKELYDSLEALGTTVNFGVRLNDTTNVECTKVELDENNYRLFVAVNNIPLTSIDTVLTACGYVSVDGTDYYTTDVNEYSVRTLAQKYLTDYATDDAVISAKYALIYLAYYA